MTEGRQRAEDTGVADQNVEPAVTLVERAAETVDPRVILQVQRHEGGGAALGADRVVDLLETADGARHRDHMGAGSRERERGRRADPARGACDERDAIGERLVHFHGSSFRRSAKRESRNP